MLQEGEEPTADGQEFKHRDRQVGPGIFGDLVEPEQAVAETTGSGSVNIGGQASEVTSKRVLGGPLSSARSKARLTLTLHDSKRKAARRCEHPTERAVSVEVYTSVQNVGDRGAGLEDLVAQHNDEPEVRDHIDAEPPVEVYTSVQNVGDRGAGLEDLVAQHNDEPEVRDHIDAEPPAPRA